MGSSRLVGTFKFYQHFYLGSSESGLITLIFLVVVSWSSLKGFGTKASEDWLLLSEEKSFAARQVRASRASLRSSMPELPEMIKN